MLRTVAAGGMRAAAVRVGSAEQPASKCALDRQVRHATRVGFWRKRRNLRNPHTRITRPVITHEDTRAQMLYYFRWHWMYHLRYWRKKFNEMLLHKVTDYEMENEHIPKGRNIPVVRAMIRSVRGQSFYSTDTLTYRDNPFSKSSLNWDFKIERGREYALSGRLQSHVEAGMSLEEAKRYQADMRARHRTKKAQLEKSGTLSRVLDAKMKGKASQHFDELAKKSVMPGTEAGESGGNPLPWRAMQFYEFDVESNQKKILSTPVQQVSDSLNPLVDGKMMETSAGGKVSLPGGSVYMGTSSLADDFAFPVKVGLR